MSAATMTLPFAVVAAVGARLIAKLVWRPERHSHSFIKTVQLAGVLVWRGVYFAVVRAAIQGLSLGALDSGWRSGTDSERSRDQVVSMFSRVVVVALG
jgi:hypothetical protein